MAVQIQEQKRSLWDTPLTALIQINWEGVILIALLFLAVVTRLYDLPSAAWSHDEAIHTSWANDLYSGKGYIHNPIYHGPLLYHATALAFFLLGDNDFSARLMPVLFGLALIALPYFLRPWLGPRGWVVTSILLFLSPSVAHYSRANRHDIYVEVFVVMLLLGIMQYLTKRNGNWLYYLSAVLALAFTAMETTFIFIALFGYFLTSMLTFQWFQRRTPRAKTTNALVAAVLGLPFAMAAVVAFILERIESWRGRRATERGSFDFPAFDLAVVLGSFVLPLGATPLFIKYILQRDPTDYQSIVTISGSAAALALFVLLSAGVGLIWNWRTWLICAAWFYPIMLVLFTTLFSNIAGIGSGFVGSLGYWISQQVVQRGSQPQYYYLFVTLPMYEYLPYLFGLGGVFYILFRRSWRHAVGFGVALVALLAVSFYIWFTPGILEWLTLNAPFFKGKDTLQAANFTVLLLGLLLPIFFALSYDPDDETTAFPTLVGVWALGCLVLFSWAGEKMPWLTMHMAIPLAFVSGYWMNDVLKADWRALYRRGALLLGVIMTVGLLVLAFHFFFGPAPLSGTPLDELARQASTLAAILVIGICAGLAFYLAMNLGSKNALRVALVTLFTLLALFTIRTMASAAYYNKDMATEVIVYAQGTPDVPNAMREIEELSRRLCSQTQPDAKVKLNCDNGTIKVAYDDDSSWPFVWYLRDYRNAQYYGKSPGAPFDAEVVIVGDANESAVKPFLGSRYLKRQMRLVWWPDEGYKNLDWAKLFGTTDEEGNRIEGVFSPENFKKLVRDIWFFRKYDTSLNNWPYVHRFSFYVRKDVANLLWRYAGVAPAPAPSLEEDLYLKKFIPNLQARAVVTAPSGAFNSPKNLAVDEQGNLYVLDTNNHRVLKFDASRAFVKEWGGQGAAPGQFNEPWGIAVAPEGTVYVADTWNHRIQKFDANGNFITMWGTFADHGTNLHGDLLQMYGPRAIAIDQEGNLLVTDTGNERVIKFSPDGEPLHVFGGTGAEAGQFLEPVGIGLDREGNIYVADTWNRRIQKFSKDYEPLAQWNIEAWDSQSVVNKPYLAVDAQANIYVTDPEGYRVLEFSKDGALEAIWGIPGSDLASFQLPTGIVVDSAGNVYVADSGNNRVLIFEPIGK